MYTENYKNNQRKTKKMCTAKKKANDLKELEGMEEANKRNEAM